MATPTERLRVGTVQKVKEAAAESLFFLFFLNVSLSN